MPVHRCTLPSCACVAGTWCGCSGALGPTGQRWHRYIDIIATYSWCRKGAQGCCARAFRGILGWHIPSRRACSALECMRARIASPVHTATHPPACWMQPPLRARPRVVPAVVLQHTPHTAAHPCNMYVLVHVHGMHAYGAYGGGLHCTQPPASRTPGSRPPHPLKCPWMQYKTVSVR